MELEENLRRYKSGLLWCGISLLAIPVGLLAIGGGPCAGPRDGLGAAILLGAGLSAFGGAVVGISRILRNRSAATELLKAFGILGVCGAVLSGLVGIFYSALGAFVSADYLDLMH